MSKPMQVNSSDAAASYDVAVQQKQNEQAKIQAQAAQKLIEAAQPPPKPPEPAPLPEDSTYSVRA